MGARFALEGGLSPSLAIAGAAVLVIEGAVLHLLVASRSQMWAWAITAANVWTLVWLWREVKAAVHSALVVSETEVEIVVGKRLRFRVARGTIASAEVATWRSVPDVPPADYINAAKPLEPNVLLSFRKPAVVRLPLGIRKRVSRVGLRARDTERLLQALRGSTAGPDVRATPNA